MKDTLLPLSSGEVFSNGRVKINPHTGAIMECVVSSRPIFKAVAADVRGHSSFARKGPLPGQEVWEAEEASSASFDREEAIKEKNRARCVNRARRRLFDLAYCNDFDSMCTLTLSPEKVDSRYDYKGIQSLLNRWLDNRVRRKGLRYVLVPELHKDGAIHYHGLINGDSLSLVDSGHRDEAGRPVYNAVDYPYGFSTVVHVDEHYEAVCRYVSKYITKQMGADGPIGGRYYLHGGKLDGPVYRFYSVDFKQTGGKEVEIEGADLTLHYLSEEEFFKASPILFGRKKEGIIAG